MGSLFVDFVSSWIRVVLPPVQVALWSRLVSPPLVRSADLFLLLPHDLTLPAVVAMRCRLYLKMRTLCNFREWSASFPKFLPLILLHSSPSMPPALANQPIVQQQQPAAIAAAAAYAATAQAHVGELDIFSDFLSVPPTPRGGSAAPAPLPSPAALPSPVVANYPSPSPAEALGGARVSGGFESPVDQFAPSPSSNRERGISNSTPNGSRKSSLAFNNEEQSKKWEHGEKCDRLRVVACSARNVMAKSYLSYFTKFFGGIVSSSDCQCNLKFGSREYSTAVVEGTLQPTWNNAYDFNYDTSNAQHDRLHVEIIHVGLLGPKLLGCVDVAINTLDDSPDRCVTKWFELQSGPESKDRTRPRGEVLLSILRHPVRFHPTSTKLPPVIDPEKPDKHIVLQ